MSKNLRGNFEKKINSNKDSINLLGENVRKLHNRTRKLEKYICYPNKEELEKMPLYEGTDPD